MTQPTLVSEEATVFNSSTAPKVFSSTPVQTGDLLVIVVVSAGPNDFSITAGTGLTWATTESINTTGRAAMFIFTTTATSNTNISPSVQRDAGATNFYGARFYVWRASDGFGAAESTNTTGAPSLAITTSSADSAIVVVNADFDAVDGASRTWREGTAGTLTEDLYFRDAAQYTAYIGAHLNAGAAGAKTVGLSAPSGQTYSIGAIEIRGTAGGGGSSNAARAMYYYRQRRAA